MTQLADHARRRRLVVGNIALLLPPLAPLVRDRRRRGARGAAVQAVFWARDRRVGGAVVRRADRLGGRRAAARDAAAVVQVAHRPAAVRLGAAADRARRLAASSGARRNRDYRRASTSRCSCSSPASCTGRSSSRLATIRRRRRSRCDRSRSSVRSSGWRRSTGLVLAARSAADRARGPACLPAAGVRDGARLRHSRRAVRDGGRGDYGTGSPADIGWMLPFFFAAWAATASPASPALSRAVSPTRPLPQASPALLFVGIADRADRRLRAALPDAARRAGRHLRDMATACTLVCGIALVLVRLRVEQRARRAGQPARCGLLATACEQAGELIIIVGRDSRIEYANDAFCRASGYTHEELESLHADRARRRGVARRRSRSSIESLKAREGDAADGVARAQGRQHLSDRRASLRRSSTRRPRDAFRRRHPRHHRGAAAARTARARRTAVGARRVRLRRRARDQQPAAVDHRIARAGARPACSTPTHRGDIERARFEAGPRRTHRPQPAARSSGRRRTSGCCWISTRSSRRR